MGVSPRRRGARSVRVARSAARGGAGVGFDHLKRALDPGDVAYQLTPQELQIAQLVAEGLSNREVGQRLYLSHRTVASHLYRMFPKLSVTSRAQLAQALAPSQPVGLATEPDHEAKLSAS
jgi:DNA-binding NarL/FixJ family response regulator